MSTQDGCPRDCQTRFAEVQSQILANREVSLTNREEIAKLDVVVRGNGRPGVLTNQAILEHKVDELISYQKEAKKVSVAIIVGIVMMVAETLWQIVQHVQAP